jgi:hypothetical protein
MSSVAITTAEAAALRKLLSSQRCGAESLRWAGAVVVDGTLSWNVHEQASVAEAIANQASAQVDRGFESGVWIELSERLARLTGDASFRFDWKPELPVRIHIAL